MARRRRGRADDGDDTWQRKVAAPALQSAASTLPATPVITGPVLFLPQVIYSAGSNTNSALAAMADVNGDGKLDLDGW